jgi:hypothetical protein
MKTGQFHEETDYSGKFHEETDYYQLSINNAMKQSLTASTEKAD